MDGSRTIAPVLEPLFLLLRLEVNNRFQDFVWCAVHVANATAVDEQRRRARYFHLLPQGNGGIHSILSFGLGIARCDLAPLGAYAVSKGSQLLISVGLGNIRLSIVGGVDEFPECIMVGAADAVGIRRGLSRPIMGRQGKLLKHKTRVGLLTQQLVNRGLCLFAMWTLQVTKFHDGYRRIGRPS